MGLFGGLGAVLGAVNPVGLIGTALATGGDVLNYFGTQDTNAQNAANVDRTNAANMAIANNANITSAQAAEQANQLSLDFAQNGISWRIADAAKNGISPLAALGASEPSVSPAMPVMSTPTMQTPSYTSALSTAGAGMNDFGQNLSRALTATQSPAQQASDALDLARKAKENDLLDVQIAQAKLALAHQGDTPGMPLAFRSVVNRDGSTSVVPTHGGEFFGPALWSIHNKLIPAVTPGPSDNPDVSPAGISAQWDQ